MELLYKEETYQLIGAAFEVYNQLGTGFLEPVYQEAYEMELRSRNIPFVAQQEIHFCYKGQPLRRFYVADLVAFGKIIVELKSVDDISS